MNRRIKKCIWMEAEIVDYKICDLDFNCDSCTLHSRLTGRKHLENESNKSDHVHTVEISILDLNPTYFHAGAQYYENHCWIKHVGKNTILIGVDEFFLGMWCGVKSILLATPGTELIENSCFSWIVLPKGIVSLKIPFPAHVLNSNSQAHSLDFDDFRKQQWEDRWFLKLHIQDHKLNRDKWLTKQQYLDLLNNDSNTIKQVVKDQSTLQNYGTIASGGKITNQEGQNTFTISMDLFRGMAKQVFHNNHIFI